MENSCGKFLQEILVGKIFWEILAGNSCGKILQEILACGKIFAKENLA